MTTPRALNRAGCLALLGTARIGRLVYTRHGLPAVLPLGFALAGDAVVARVDPDLLADVRGSVVAFEVDVLDGEPPGGWWVTLVGRAGLAEGPAPCWPAGLAGCGLRIPAEVISGFRVP